MKEERMLVRLCLIILLILMAGCAAQPTLRSVPTEIERYCQQISGSGDGAAEAMRMCILQEQEARSRISALVVPGDVQKRCGRLSRDTGGSYQVLLTCIQQELDEY